MRVTTLETCAATLTICCYGKMVPPMARIITFNNLKEIKKRGSEVFLSVFYDDAFRHLAVYYSNATINYPPLSALCAFSNHFPFIFYVLGAPKFFFTQSLSQIIQFSFVASISHFWEKRQAKEQWNDADLLLCVQCDANHAIVVRPFLDFYLLKWDDAVNKFKSKC